MKLVKDGYVFNTTDDTVIKAYKLNGFVEAVEEKPQPKATEEKPKTTKKK